MERGDRLAVRVIRPAGEADLPGILAIVNHAIEHTTAHFDLVARTPEQQRAWMQERVAAGLPVLVAAEGAALLGFGSYGPFRSRAAYARTVEHSVYVAEAARGRGVGRALLGALIEHARAQGVHVMVGGLDGSNAASLAFHRALGFREAGRLAQVGWKFGRWLDLVFMHRILEEAQ